MNNVSRTTCSRQDNKTPTKSNSVFPYFLQVLLLFSVILRPASLCIALVQPTSTSLKKKKKWRGRFNKCGWPKQTEDVYRIQRPSLCSCGRRSNLQKFFHQKSAVSINILKIANTAAKRTHTHTHPTVRSTWMMKDPGRFLVACTLLLPAAIWFMDACADICHVPPVCAPPTASPSIARTSIVGAENYATKIFLSP